SPPAPGLRAAPRPQRGGRADALRALGAGPPDAVTAPGPPPQPADSHAAGAAEGDRLHRIAFLLADLLGLLPQQRTSDQAVDVLATVDQAGQLGQQAELPLEGVAEHHQLDLPEVAVDEDVALGRDEPAAGGARGAFCAL